MFGDIGLNPGPVYRYPCTICTKPVQINQRDIGCDRCDRWTHAACCGVSVDEYEQLDAQGESSLWFCPSCISKELPFADVSQCTESGNGECALFGSHSSLEVEAEPLRLFDAEGRDNLVVSHLNIRSLSSKLDELRNLLERESGLCMVFGLSETWLDGSIADAEVEIAGFRSY